MQENNVIRNNTIVHGSDANDVLFGTREGDKIYGGKGNDRLIGGEGNDELNGGEGNDRIIGGRGYDDLAGGSGNDIYIFSKGDGKDNIFNYQFDNIESYRDKIQFTDVSSDEVNFRGENSDLIIEYGYGDSICIKAFFASSHAHNADIVKDDFYVHEFQFTDKVMTLADLANMEIPVTVSKDFQTNWSGKLHISISGDVTSEIAIQAGTGNTRIYGNSNDDVINGNIGDDTIYGFEGDDSIYGGAGNDLIYGGDGADYLLGEAGNDSIKGESGNDIIYGGTGNDQLEGDGGDDWLYGEEGDDILIGGEGDDALIGGEDDDTLNGGAGHDTYYFSKGDGNDVINNYQANNEQFYTDKIRFLDIRSDEVTFRGEDQDLILDYGSGDSIRIENFFNSSGAHNSGALTYDYYIHEFEFSDGVLLTLDNLAAKVIPVTITKEFSTSWAGGIELIDKRAVSTYYSADSNASVSISSTLQSTQNLVDSMATFGYNEGAVSRSLSGSDYSLSDNLFYAIGS